MAQFHVVFDDWFAMVQRVRVTCGPPVWRMDADVWQCHSHSLRMMSQKP
jgi:hypothetical protein